MPSSPEIRINNVSKCCQRRDRRMIGRIKAGRHERQKQQTLDKPDRNGGLNCDV
jgi:hypothetical protein